MPGKRARPFVRTSSRPQLLQSCGYDSPPLSPVGVKYAMGAPQRVVVGFDVVGGAESNTKPSLDTCESPRSVLEPDALSDHHCHHRPSALSPRSALDRLLSGPESRPSCKAGVGLGIVAAIRQEELAVRKTTLGISCRGNPINAISERISGVDPQNCTFKVGRPSNAASNHVNASSDVDFSDGEEDDDDHLAADMQGSIFCTASPFSNRCSLDTLAGDFLSVCFFCKSRLMMGKDIFMYRGDRAFCSSECRYQPIVIDELKERQPAETNCYHVRPLMC